MMKSQGSLYSWCGCRDRRAGRPLGSRCPRRGRPGHGSWYVSVELPAGPDGGRRRIRRGGFPDHAAAQAARRVWPGMRTSTRRSGARHLVTPTRP